MFRDTTRRGSVDPGSSPAARRLRRVEVEWDRVFPGGQGPSAARAADRLTLDLFPDVCVTAVRESATDLGGGRVQWEGRIQGATRGTVTLVVDVPVMVGTIRIDREVYQIRYLGEGVHAVVDVDPSRFPGD